MLNTRALLLATVLGTILQVGMILAGHSNPSIKAFWAVGGMGFSLVAGIAYAAWARGSSTGSLALGGAIAGAVCALVGIFGAYMAGDVPASLLLLGTISSAVTGALGGWAGKFIFRAATVVVLLTAATFGAGARAEAQAPSHAMGAHSLAAGASGGATAAIATTEDFRWLAGRWTSDVTSVGGTADVRFDLPAAGLITGTMRLVKGSEVLVVELLSLVDTPDGVELRFRHFSSKLDAYEGTFKQNMRLTSHSADVDVFENMVAYDKGLMSTQPRLTSWTRINQDTFVGRSDIIGADGKAGMIESTYRRVK